LLEGATCCRNKVGFPVPRATKSVKITDFIGFYIQPNKMGAIRRTNSQYVQAEGVLSFY
jgi:hypothetical protein